jgi:hypothetical protein
MSRSPIHSRTITCNSFKREDGLYDIEAQMVDSKSYSFTSHDHGEVKAGQPVHDMRIVATIDADYLIHAIEVEMAATPFRFCPTIAPDFSALAGTRIGKGWHKQIIARFGGVQGCTHVVELLRTVGTVAYQTLANLRHTPETLPEKPAHIGTCHALKEDGPVVQWLHPHYYIPHTSGE